ncbi:MAG: cytochrome b [Hyphomicrobium sp.]
MNYDIPIYSRIARHFHWWVAFLIFLQLPIGFYMNYRRTEMPSTNEAGETVLGVSDGITKFFYSSHKFLGLFILVLVLLRLIYRFAHGVPKPDTSVPPMMIGISHLVHWVIYLLLIFVPIGGYIAISYGGYLDVFGFSLPPVTAKDTKFAEELFEFHAFAASLLLALVSIHIIAALYHRFIRRDRILERMIPHR